MTGYESKRAAAQDKLEPWDNEAFSNWWDADYDDRTNPYEKDSFAYWAWAGWQAALAQPAQKPVAYLCGPDENGLFGLPTADKGCKACFPVYRQSPQRPWVGLTKEAIAEFGTWHDNREEEVGWVPPSEIVAYINAKLKEKNDAV